MAKYTINEIDTSNEGFFFVKYTYSGEEYRHSFPWSMFLDEEWLGEIETKIKKLELIPSTSEKNSMKTKHEGKEKTIQE